MKTYRQREKQGSKVQESTKGPDEAKIKVILIGKQIKVELILRSKELYPKMNVSISSFYNKLLLLQMQIGRNI